MAALQNFRSALNGFNREDVVHYIAYINDIHNSELSQLRTQILDLNAQLEEMRQQPDPSAPVREALAASEARCAALTAELEALRGQLEQAKLAAARPQTCDELEAYRRAERNERVAGERVTQLYEKANSVLAEATVRVDESAAHISDLVDQVSIQLAQLQTAVLEGRSSMKDAAAAMYAIRPVSPEM